MTKACEKKFLKKVINKSSEVQACHVSRADTGFYG
jgi:hypothetical protein